MSVQPHDISPRDIPSHRSLIGRERSLKRPKVKRFNSKIFERQPADISKAKALTLKQTELPYELKKKKAEQLRISSFKYALLNASLTMVVVLCALIDWELVEYRKVEDLQSSAIRVLIISVSLLQMVVTIKYSKCKLKRRKLQGLQHLKSMQLRRFLDV